MNAPDEPTPDEGYRLSEVVRRAHRRGPTSRWAAFYRRHWRTWRRYRKAQWNRPPEPHDWRWAVGLLGRGLITSGLLMLGFVAYQLWGTGIATARAQRDLAATFAAQIAATPATSTTVAATTTLPGSTTTVVPLDITTTTSTVPPAPALEVNLGDPVARLEIPTIDVDQYVVAGVGVDELQLGPGHFPDTPLPGQLGNAAIAGHRTTYGQPFHDVDQLMPGDEIVATTASGRYVYRVRETLIVEPSDYHVVATTDPTIAELTLTSCHPKWSAAQRIIIHADLDLAASDVPTARGSYIGSTADTTTTVASTTSTLPSEATTTTVDAATPTTTTTVAVMNDAIDTSGTSTGTTDAFAAGWFHDPRAISQTVLWALPMLGLLVVIRWWSHRRRSWFPAAPIGLLPGLVVLYFLYENVNGLLPPNL